MIEVRQLLENHLIFYYLYLELYRKGTDFEEQKQKIISIIKDSKFIDAIRSRHLKSLIKENKVPIEMIETIEVSDRNKLIKSNIKSIKKFINFLKINETNDIIDQLDQIEKEFTWPTNHYLQKCFTAYFNVDVKATISSKLVKEINQLSLEYKSENGDIPFDVNRLISQLSNLNVDGETKKRKRSYIFKQTPPASPPKKIKM